jgi:BirA family biotin operon repressor/biotin-[acetyl-CoA-carboxylase] ligase
LYKNPTKTNFVGKQLIYLPSCHSTNDYVAEMSGSGSLSEGTVVVTGHQTSGRGQRGNTWISEKNSNLTFSILLRPYFLHPGRSYHLYMMCSVALATALEKRIQVETHIKWPNDLYYQGLKLAGILIENSVQQNKLNQTIIGIGLNVNQIDFGSVQATSIKRISGIETDLNELLGYVLLEIERCYNQLKLGLNQELVSEYENRLYWKNEMHLFDNGSLFYGMITGIDETGRLMIDSGGMKTAHQQKGIRFVE